MRNPKNKVGSIDRISRAGFGYRPTVTARLMAGGIPNLNDPDLKAAAFYKDGAWVVVPGPASALYDKRWMQLPGTTAAFATSTAGSNRPFTEEIDIRAHVALDQWAGAAAEIALVSKWDLNPGQRCFSFSVTEQGRLQLRFSRDGIEQIITNTAVLSATTYVNGTAHWVRVTRAASTGVVRFFVSTDGIAWTQVGADSVMSAGNLFNSSLAVTAGGIGSGFVMAGKMFYADIRNRIDGTATVTFDPRVKATDGATSFTSSTGETWTLNSTASIQSAVAVSNPAANSFEPSPFWPDSTGPMMVAKDITDATAPYVTAIDAQSLLGAGFWSGNHTVYAVAHPTATTSTAPVVIGHGVAVQDGFYLNPTTVQVKAGYSDGVGAQEATTTPLVHSKWTVISASRSGSNYVVRANGTESTTAVTRTALNPSTRNLYFGRYNNAGQPMRGPLACVLFYSAAHTSGQKSVIEAQLLGTGVTTTAGIAPIVTTRASAIREMSGIEPENLVTRSQDFDNAIWAKGTGLTVTPNAGLAPDGTMTACRVNNLNAAATGDRLYQTGLPYVASAFYAGALWVKGEGTDIGKKVILTLKRNSGATFAGASNVVILDGTWQKVTVTTVMAADSVNGVFSIGNDDTTTSAANPLVWAAQTNKGLLVPYVRTFADPRTAGPFMYAVGDNARIPHPTKGLPCFAAVTNLCLQSEDFGLWGGTPLATVTAGQLAPNRTLTASILTDADGTSTSARTQNFTVAGADTATRVFSIFLKKTVNATPHPALSLLYSNGGVAITYMAVFNPNTGVVTAQSSAPAPARAAVTDCGDYWRLELAGANNGTGNTNCSITVYPIWNNTGAIAASVAAQGANTFWGAQFEVGIFAGAYVPTTTVSASSVIDAHSISTAGWPTTSGELEVEFTPANAADLADTVQNFILDSRVNGGLGPGLIVYITSNALWWVPYNGTTSAGIAASLAWVGGQTYRLKFRWSPSRVEIWRDGVLINSSTNPTVLLTGHQTTAALGGVHAAFGGGFSANAHIKVLYLGKLR